MANNNLKKKKCFSINVEEKKNTKTIGKGNRFLALGRQMAKAYTSIEYTIQTVNIYNVYIETKCSPTATLVSPMDIKMYLSISMIDVVVYGI